MSSFYAVRVGREGPKIYRSWEDCSKATHRFSGSILKKFKNKNDAEAFISIPVEMIRKTKYSSHQVTTVNNNVNEIIHQTTKSEDQDICVYEMTRKYHHRLDQSINQLKVLLIGNVIDAVSSFAVSRPQHICILDEVVTSSREYKEGEASGWDDFLEFGRSDMWDEMKYQSKASLQYISKKRIPLKKIKKITFIGKQINTIYRKSFDNIRLDKVIEVDIHGTEVTDADMADLGRACPNVQSLNISGCRNITDVGLIEFSRYCDGLKDINIGGCSSITNIGLNWFSYNCREVQVIYLTACDGIVAGGILGLLKYCSNNLRIIKIGGFCKNKSICTDADLLALSINCQQLQELYLYHCDEITDDGLIEMSKHLNSNKQFHLIDIHACQLMSNRGVIGFSKNCPQLKSITIRGENLTDDCMIELSKNCSGLESINISNNDWVTENSLLAIAQNCRGLKNINISSCGSVTEEGCIVFIENSDGLESIEISNYWLAGAGLNAIAKNCRHLKAINISNCRSIKEESFLNLIKKRCIYLETIEIAFNFWVTDKSMNMIATGCRSLKYINIVDCRNITNAGFSKRLSFSERDNFNL